MATQLQLPPQSAVLAVLCKKSFVDFVKEFWDTVPGTQPLKWNWHIDLIADEVSSSAFRIAKEQPRQHDLIFNVPFGTSKSSVISILFPAWVWTFYPQCRFLTATHTDKLVRDLASKFRSVVTSDKYRLLFPGVELVKEGEDYLTNNHGGDRNTCTVGGKTPTGFHSHVFIIDDPLDPQGARSDAELEKASKFMTEVIPGRVVDKAISITILVMQRLHPRDPTAVLENVGKLEGAVPVRKICLPGEIDSEGEVSPPLSYLRERYGEEVYTVDGLLDPIRLPRSVLVSLRAKMGAFSYAGQVKQNPTLPGGGMFKAQYFSQRLRSAPYDCKRIRYWDRAASDGAGCFTAGVLMAKDKDGCYYVEDVIHGQWEPKERNDIIEATAKKDRVRYGPRYEPIIYVEAERGSTGLESFQNLARRLAGYRVREDRPSGSKDVRAEPWADQLAAHNVWFIEGNWDLNGYIEEHVLFRPDPVVKRLGKYKDQVDASSGAFNLLAKIGSPEGRILILRSRQKKDKVRVVYCSAEQLTSIVLEEPALLCVVSEPDVPTLPADVPVPILLTSDSNQPDVPIQPLTSAITRSPADVPQLASDQLLDHVCLYFADLNPADLQQIWSEPLPPYNRLPADLLMTRKHAQQIWAMIRRQRTRQPDTILLCGQGGIPQSLALAVADGLQLVRSESLEQLGSDVLCDKDTQPLNSFIYQMCRDGRHLVM